MPIHVRLRQPGVAPSQLEKTLLRRAAQLRRARPGRSAVRQVERERQRLGRELHTGVGQLLAAIRMQLDVLAGHLAEPLRQLWQVSGLAPRFASSVQAFSLPRDPEPDVKTLLYRAAQEALANIVRHSHATRVDLSLAASASGVVLTVHHDGVGFDHRILAGSPGAPVGIGLRALREQAEDAGGKFLVRSGPGGTTLEVSVPLAA